MTDQPAAIPPASSTSGADETHPPAAMPGGIATDGGGRPQVDGGGRPIPLVGPPADQVEADQAPVEADPVEPSDPSIVSNQ